MNNHITGNKGEWSEPYVLLKLLADGVLEQGQSDTLNPSPTPYEIIEVHRSEGGKENKALKNYLCDSKIISISVDGKNYGTVSRSEFKKYSQQLLLEIKNGKGTFKLSQSTIDFLTRIQCSQHKAASQDKADIHLVIHDLLTGTNPNLGFSIKSQLGSASTLLNASINNTNFRYLLQGSITNADALKINSLSPSRAKIQARIQALLNLGIQLQFDQVLGTTYRNNLLLLDSDLSRILAECLYLYYSGEGSALRKLITKLNATNPLCYPDVETYPFYSFKLKKFLLETALGMVPNTPWSGIYDATGGYIIVKRDGELLSYHLLRKNYFEDYLLNFTKLDSPSTTRHDYGKVYFENDQAYFNLNLQIRFEA